MSLHIVVMVVTIGATNPGAAAHPAYSAPTAVVTCASGAMIDLRARGIECLTPAAKHGSALGMPVVQVPTSQVTHMRDRSTGAMPASSRPLGDPLAATAATIRGTQPLRHVVRTPALPSRKPLAIEGHQSGKRLSGNPRPGADSAPFAAINHDATITHAAKRDTAAPTPPNGHMTAPGDVAVQDTGPGSGVGLPLTNDRTNRPTPMASFEGPADPRGYQTHAGSSASRDETAPSLRLPAGGEHPYVTPDKKSGRPVRLKGGQGFLDRKGNRWVPDRTKQGEWDVEHSDGSHTNVSENGNRTHGKDEFPGHKASQSDAGHSGWWWLGPAAVAAGALLAAPVTDGGSLLLLPAGA